MHVDAETVIFFGALVVAVILHEISHGLVAFWFGDRTAKDAGRLTLNPIPHIDPFGSIILPAMGALTGIPVIGWAKPVPVNPGRLRNPRTQMFLVSLAGPTTNFLLATAGALAAALLLGSMSTGEQVFLRNLPSGAHLYNVSGLPTGFQIAYSFALVNLLLGVFNLIPVPPLDGSAIFELVMPDAWKPTWWRFRPYGLILLFALVFWTGLVGTLIDPFVRVLDAIILA